MTIIIKSEDVKSKTIEDAVSEIFENDILYSLADLMSQAMEEDIMVVIEDVANHIIYTDTDYVYFE